MRAGRSNIFPATSNVSIMCAKSMPALVVRAMETTRKWKPQPSRRRRSTRALPDRGC
jgi:hypothetical protein